MKLEQAFKMAIKSIMVNKGRSFLTMLGIIIGIASVMTIVSVVNGLNKKTMQYYESMGTNKVTVYAYMYNGQDIFNDLYDYCLKLGDIVIGVTPNAQFNATVVYGMKNSDNMGGGGGMSGMGMASDSGSGGSSNLYPPTLYLGSDQFSVCNNFTIEKGRDLSSIDVKDYAQVCVLGARAAKDFFDYADPVGKDISVNGVPFTVLGVYEEKDAKSDYSLDNIIVFPYTAARYMGQQIDMSQFTVKAKDSAATDEAISRITGFLAGLIPETAGSSYVYSENQWMQQDNQLTTIMSLVLGGIAFISLLVGGIGIMNIMLVTVTERTREIGIRRAIGAERSSIVTQFLIEAATICAVGGVIGILSGTLLTLILGKLLLKFVLFPTVGITIFSFALSVGLGILFGIFPAVKASRLQPVAALRAE
ncbi:MAG: ABC transporter permease [Oscillospiraceae bacterium]|nr:ABC transporter permease [Oscillospiraceae bacterium]